MERTNSQFHINTQGDFVAKLCSFAQRYSHFSILDSNNGELLAAIEAVTAIDSRTVSVKGFGEFLEQERDWLFGGFSYNLKNELEALSSSTEDPFSVPNLFFFKPRWVIKITGNSVEVLHANSPQEAAAAAELVRKIEEEELKQSAPKSLIHMLPGITKKRFLELVTALQKHIGRGDVYEINFCHNFIAELAVINPAELWVKLNDRAKAPFSAFFGFSDFTLLSASPERFMQRRGNRLISQPIKGTIRRGKDASEDGAFKQQLVQDPKERAENIMIVDLVRNDLSRIAAKGSVQVHELCGIYTFNTLHQMISTVSCSLREDKTGLEAILAAFPPGSMTGAPKIRAMQLIDQYEEFNRGLYAGSVGYFEPNGNFDFNVVIRSILYNKQKQCLSYAVGGAITSRSEPEMEYEETMLKAEAMKQVIDSY